MSEISAENIKWYKTDIRDLTDAEYKKWYSLMNEEKQNRVDRFRSDDDKKRTVAAEMLARKAVAQWCSVSAESVTFYIGEYGKPYVDYPDVEFNVSHSGNMVVCAIASKPVGIDIEEIRPVNLKMAKRFCSKREIEYLFGHIPQENELVHTTDNDLLSRFFKIWTQKEAYLKYIGTGLLCDDLKIDCECSIITDIPGYIVAVCSD